MSVTHDEIHELRGELAWLDDAFHALSDVDRVFEADGKAVKALMKYGVLCAHLPEMASRVSEIHQRVRGWDKHRAWPEEEG